MIEVVIDDDKWTATLPGAESLCAACFNAAAAIEPEIRGETAILLTDDATMRDLNKRFRGKDKPTNVLSFPAATGDDFFGDIALGREICLREAEAFGISIADHTTHLTVHGLLHLAGYDHQSDEEAAKMEAAEIAILARLGVANPYQISETDDA